MASLTTNFDGSQNPFAESGFTDGFSSWAAQRKVSGLLVPVNANEDAAARLDSPSIGADQFSRAVWGPTAVRTTPLDARDWPSVLVRCQPSSGACYAFAWDPTVPGWVFYYITDNGSALTFNQLGAGISGSFAADAVIELRVRGTTLYGYYNGTLLGTRTDSNLSSGQPGIATFQGAADTTRGWTSWSGGDWIAAQTSETDTAQAVTHKKTRALGQPSETETAQTKAGSGKRKAVGQSTETDTADVVIRKPPLGQNTETDTAQAVTRQRTKATGQAAETDTAQIVVRGGTSAAVGQTSEIDSAQTLTKNKRRAVGQASETESATVVSRKFLNAVGQTSSTATAQALTRNKRRTLGQVTEAETAQTVTPSSVITAFPISAHASKRYLVDANGDEFVLSVRTLWKLPSLSLADVELILDDSVAKGFTGIEFELINRDTSTNQAPYANDGTLLPFTHRLSGAAWNGAFGGSAPDFTTPNSSYWAFIDDVIDACAERGLLCLAYPSYVGYFGTSEGWMSEMESNGATRMETYGAYVADRYADRTNIVWMLGGDRGTSPHTFTAGQIAVEQGLIDGLESVTPQASGPNYAALWTGASISTDQADFDQYITINGAYYDPANDSGMAQKARDAYSHSPTLPAWAQEGPYDEEGPDGNNRNPLATQPTRRFAYWGWLNAIGGTHYSNGYVWTFASGWEDHLNTQAAQDQARLNAFVQTIRWWELVPRGLSGAPTLVTSGGGTLGSSNYVAGAITPDGRLAVLYVPPAHTGSVTVDLSVFASRVRARWFDPTDGSYTHINYYPNSGTQAFTVPGNNDQGSFDDWILLLDTPPPIAQISETDTAQAITRRKQKAIGQLVETYTAQALAKATKRRAAGQTSETDTGLTLTRRKSRAVGQVADTEIAQNILEGDDLGIVEESDFAQDVGVLKSRTLGYLDHTDTAQAVTALRTMALAGALEIDEALTVNRVKVRRLLQVTETDFAIPGANLQPPLPHVVAMLQPSTGRIATLQPSTGMIASLQEEN